VSSLEKLAVVETDDESIETVAMDRLGKFLSTIGGKDAQLQLKLWNTVQLTQSAARVKGTPVKTLLLGSVKVHCCLQEKDADPDTLHLYLGCEQGIRAFSYGVENNSIEEHQV